MKIKRISTLALLEAFEQLYISGVNFVDMEGENKEEYDVIHMTFGNDYIDPDYLQDFIEEEEPIKIEGDKLTDDDIKDLI